MKPHILVTNDDGVDAPGLLALSTALRNVGQVTVLAPDRNWSASGHVKTMHRPLRVKQVKLADGSDAYASDGAPSDCVALAMLGFISDPIDIVVSGINPNANIGHDVTYSGTVTAAMEASINGVPGVAVSLDLPAKKPALSDFDSAARVAGTIVDKLLDNGSPKDTIININVPYLAGKPLKGTKISRLGSRVYRDQLESRMDPRGNAYFWIGGDAPTGIDEPGTDYGCLQAGYVSITPLQLDLTHYQMIDSLQNIHW